MYRRFVPALLFAAMPVAATVLAVGSGGPPAPGGVIEVAVPLSAEGASVSGVSFDLEYDATALSVRAGAGAAAVAADKTLDAYEPVAGKLRILVIGMNGNALGDGAVASLAVTVKTSDAAAFTLKLSNAAATDQSGTAVSLAVLDGQVTTDSSLPRITSVVHGATFQAGLPAGGWTEINGNGFAASARAWSDADLAGGRLPERLLGVSVEFGGKPGYVSFVSPDRLEVLAPGAETDMDIAVRVVAPQGASDPFPATSYALAPGFFPAGDPGGQYVLATHADGSRASPARPGEVVLLSGTGFGPTLPQGAEGIAPAVAPLAKPCAITIGGEPAEVQFAGIVAPGRYQFNVVIPESAAEGDQEVIAEIDGVQSPPGRYITIERIPRP